MSTILCLPPLLFVRSSAVSVCDHHDRIVLSRRAAFDTRAIADIPWFTPRTLNARLSGLTVSGMAF